MQLKFDVMKNNVPGLLVVFNRPDKTFQVIEALRQVKPTQLFVAGDGPRPNHPEDIEKCSLTKEISTAIDWDCELKTRFLPITLVYKKASNIVVDRM